MTRYRYTTLAVLVVLLLVGTTMPGSVKADIEGRMWSQIPWSGLAHFTLFACIAMCPVYGRGWKGRTLAIGLALVLGTTTEVLQSWVPGRHPLVRDVLIDLAGTITGLGLVAMLALRTRIGTHP